MTDIKHGGDCGGTWCEWCGCCMHGDDSKGCRIADAPIGVACPGSGCGCEGESYYDRPVQPEPALDDEPTREVQLHQETALDFGEWRAS